MATTLIRGGTVVSATGRGAADVLVDGATIAAVLLPGSTLLGMDLAKTVDTVIEAHGKYVIPGASTHTLTCPCPSAVLRHPMISRPARAPPRGAARLPSSTSQCRNSVSGCKFAGYLA